MKTETPEVAVLEFPVTDDRACAPVAVESLKRPRLGLVLKRAFDLVCAAFGLLVLWPLFLLTTLAVKLSSPGPVFVWLERVGRKGRPFRMVKFRTMVDASSWPEERQGIVHHVTLQHDSRITPVGRFLRRTSVDELPQLWNVLKGEMSLVGPRPQYEKVIAALDPALAEHLLRVRPGITGVAQLNGRKSLTEEDSARVSVEYLSRWSFARDLVVILKTPVAVVRHVYDRRLNW